MTITRRLTAPPTIVSLCLIAAVWFVMASGHTMKASERPLTAAEMLTSFGGDGAGQVCGSAPNCYPSGYYTQSCSSLTGTGQCTQVVQQSDNDNSLGCVDYPYCPPNQSSCAMTGANMICASTYSCQSVQQVGGGVVCQQYLKMTDQYNQVTCQSVECKEAINP